MIDLADPYRYVPVKYPYIGGTRWNFFKWADIKYAKDPKRVYLRRLRIVQTPWFALYLHFIYMPDDDRCPHDHPFAFHSLVLRGGYTERLWPVKGMARRIWRRYEKTKTWGRWSLHRMPLDQAHMIDVLEPNTVTLVWAGPKKQQWGFYPDDDFVPWDKYDRANGEPMVDEHS